MGLWVIVGHVISVWIKTGLGLSDADREIHRLKIGSLGMGMVSVIHQAFLAIRMYGVCINLDDQ